MQKIFSLQEHIKLCFNASIIFLREFSMQKIKRVIKVSILCCFSFEGAYGMAFECSPTIIALQKKFREQQEPEEQIDVGIDLFIQLNNESMGIIDQAHILLAKASKENGAVAGCYAIRVLEKHREVEVVLEKIKASRKSLNVSRHVRLSFEYYGKAQEYYNFIKGMEEASKY